MGLLGRELGIGASLALVIASCGQGTSKNSGALSGVPLNTMAAAMSTTLRLDIDRQQTRSDVTSLRFRIERVVVFSTTPPNVHRHHSQDCDLEGGKVIAPKGDILVDLDFKSIGRTTVGDFDVDPGAVTEVRLLIEDVTAVRHGQKHVVATAESCELKEHRGWFHEHRERLGVLRLVPDRATSTFAGRMVEATALFDPTRDLKFIDKDHDNDADDHRLSLAADYGLRPLPFLLSFTPTSGAPGDAVTLTGQGFDEPNLQVLFTALAPASIASFTDTSIAVSVPAAAIFGPLTVSNSFGTATWVQPFVPNSNNGSLPPADLATCAQLAGTAIFGTALQHDRVVLLQETSLPVGTSGRVCKISFFDYTSNSFLGAVLDLATNTVLASRTVPNGGTAMGITEESDARTIAEAGATLSAVLAANPGFQHVGLVRGESGTCATHRCIELVYQKKGPIQSSNNAPEGTGPFTFLQLFPIARTIVDLSDRTVVSTEVF